MPQVEPVHKLHEQEIESPGLPEVVNGDDVRVVQSREGLRLPRETLGKLGVAHALGRQKLERHEPVQGFLARFVHDTHAAPPQAFQDFKLRKMRGDLVRRQRRLRGSRVVREHGFRLEVQCHQAIWAQPRRRILAKRCPALRTD